MTDFEVPDEFFVVVTTEDPVVSWNMSLGTISSASVARAAQAPQEYFAQQDQWFPFLPNPEFRTAVSWQLMRVIANYQVEPKAEHVRSTHYPHLPSRLGCLFAWGSLDDVREARRRMGGRFKGPVKRCSLASEPLRLARCNSAVISFARRAEERNFLSDMMVTEHVWHTYWSGSGEPLVVERDHAMDPSGAPDQVRMSDEPLWEWLIDGSLRIEGDVDAV